MKTLNTRIIPSLRAFFAYHLVALECAGIKRWFFIKLLLPTFGQVASSISSGICFWLKIPLIYAVDTTRHLHIYINTHSCILCTDYAAHVQMFVRFACQTGIFQDFNVFQSVLSEDRSFPHCVTICE